MKTRANAVRRVRKPPVQERATPPPPDRRHPPETPIASNNSETDMLTDDFPFLLPRHVEPDLASKLRKLADDLDCIAAGTAPTAAELADAPVMLDWRCVLSTVGLRLIGRVSGHPRLGDTAAMTSQLWAAGSDCAWIRTLSRFYELAEPHSDDDSAAGAADFEGGV
jgi:hypothetical protein